MILHCICPFNAEDVPYARAGLPESEGWRWYHLRGEARTNLGTHHYPGCPLYLTREEIDRAEHERILKIHGLPLTDRD